MNKLMCGIILIVVLCSCQQEQEEQEQNTILPQQLEFVVPAGGEDCDHPDCGPLWFMMDVLCLIRLRQ